jgi:phenylalanyl-tRNA synthetase beta subunit
MELAEDTVIAGRRSLLIAIKYYDSKHTLVKGEIEKIRESVLKHLETIGAEVRTAK